MGKKRRILIHTMAESEGIAAEKILKQKMARLGEALIEADASEAQIRKLRSRNLIVELLDDVAEQAGKTTASELFRASAKLDWGLVDQGALPRYPGGELPAVPSPADPGTFSLKLSDRTTEFGEVLGPIGADVVRHLRDGYALSYLRPAQRVVLEADDRVEIVPFNISPAKMPPRALTEAEQEMLAPSAGEERDFDLIAHAADRTAEIEAWARTREPELTLIGTAADRVRIRVLDTSPLVDEADQLDAVLDVRVVPEAYLCIDHVRPLVGLPAAPGAAALAGPAGALDGAGEIVGIIDGAVDCAHPDLAGRVETIHGPAGPPSAHGTHVAGIIVGDGSCSGGRYRGIAPAARLKAQALATAKDGRIDLEMDFAGMLERSYQAGVRILNLSFEENGTPSLYSYRAHELDAFAARRPDMLLVVAAGNRARTETPVYRPSGEVDLESVSAPGVAKNALTVGASCSDRTDGGHPAADWNGYAPTRFRTPPTSHAPLSGNAAMVAAFSGRGWSEEGRIKPDVVAPGTNVVAARAQGIADVLWGAHSQFYLYSGGTSMAAPVVAGCATLVRQYYRQRGHPAPSAALLKATLANGAVRLGAGASIPPLLPQPCADLDQGFGRVNIIRALALDRPDEKICFVDVPAQGAAFHSLSQGTVSPLREGSERRRFWFQCQGDGEVDLALCYTDPEPGSGTVALAFLVQPPQGERRVGNDRAVKRSYPQFGPAPDRVNTLQLVRLGQVEGKVEIQIQGLALKRHKVGFALVVKRPVAGGLLHAY